ncbi:hypothetical protein F4805DRAFT_283929 [Annulohypoxylon moriforme]|nr:hypothetical protein F4805DRAFT_283929 [Annulohypoxylon moriforme]
MEWETGFNKMGIRDAMRKPGAESEFAIDLDESSNGRCKISTRRYRAPPTRTKPDLSYYIPTRDIVLRPRSPINDESILDGWQTFPPPPVPRLDLDDVKIASGKGLRDVEEFMDEQIKRSTALRDAMEQALTRAKEIEHERDSNEDNKDGDKDAITTTQEDWVLLAEMRRMYYTFTSFEGCENHATIRRHYSEFLKHQSQQPPRTPSKMELLLGSDGSSTKTKLPQSSQLYFVGSPSKMYILPFDKAVAAGLEDVDGSKPALPSLPSALQVEPSQSGLCLPAAPFLFGPSPGKPNKVNIPEWFPFLKLPVQGDDPQSRWTNFLNTFSAFEKAIQLKDDKPKWDKTWHEPSPKWQYQFRREKGGWWKCRSGPDAPKVEAECRLCHKATKLSKQSINLEERYKEMVDAVNEAMSKVAEKDKVAALEMLHQPDQQIETSKYRMWVEEQRENKQKMPLKTAYHRTQGYNLLRGYEGLAN